MNKKDSPYTAAITGGGFLLEETSLLLPLLRATNSKELLWDVPFDEVTILQAGEISIEEE